MACRLASRTLRDGPKRQTKGALAACSHTGAPEARTWQQNFR